MCKMIKLFVVLLFLCGTGAHRNSRKALGRTPHLGDLYDRRRDLILPDSLFDEPLPEDRIETHEGRYSVFHSPISGLTFTEMANNMVVSTDEQLSLVLGITKATGSSSYLTAALEKSPNLAGDALIRLGKSTRRFYFWYQDNSALVSLETLEKTNATDMITAVTYGFETYYNLPESTEQDKKPVSGKGRSRTKVTPSPALVERSRDFVCHPDMIDRVQVPWTMSKEEMNRKIGHIFKEPNAAEPLEFFLLPLSKVRERLNLNKTLAIPYHEVPEDLSKSIVETVEKLHKLKNELSEYWNLTLCQPSIIPDSKLSLIRSFLDSWFNNMTIGISKMAQVVTMYRNGSANESKLIKAHENLSRLLSEFKYDSVESKMRHKFPFWYDYKRLELSFAKEELKLIPNSSTMKQLLKGITTFVVLKYKLDWIQRKGAEWERLKSVLLNTQVKGNWIEKADRYLLDCDILPKFCVNVTKMVVTKYEGGQSKELSQINKYLAMAGSLISSGLPRITNNSTMDDLIRGNKTFVVLKFKLPWILENPKEWDQLRSIFMNYRGMWNWFGNPDKYLMDCDLLPEHCQYVNKMVVNRYNAGQLEGAGDYMCAISKSFLGLQEKNPYGAFRASWVIAEPFREPYKPCRARRVLTKYQGIFWEQDFEIIV